MSESCAAHARAHLLLTREDTALFMSWKSNDINSDMVGNTRHAHDFSRFIHRHEWPRFSLAAPTPGEEAPHIAQYCGHKLHPSDTRTTGFCPACEMDMCLELNDAIALEWREAGGPFQGPDLDCDRYIPLRRAWYMAQKQFNALLMQIEVAVGYEKVWEKEHMCKTASILKLNTRVKAMRIATVKCKYPAVLRIEPAASQTGGKKRKRTVAISEKSKKTVSFATTQTCRSCWIVDGDLPDTAICENADETTQIQSDPEAVYHYRKVPEYYRSGAS